jgi:dTMP kinase
LSTAPAERRPLVVFEGGEGSGKSTQIGRLASWLEGRGVPVTVARDPGSTRVGQAVRSVLLDPASQPMDGRTELLLYAAARAQLVREALEPALAAGRVVLLDRYEDSTWAYQGGGRGVPAHELAAVNRVATGGLRPDLVVLLDLPPEEGLRRAAADRGADRLEGESAAFHGRVRDVYRARAAADPSRWLVLDGRRPADDLERDIRRRVTALLEPSTSSPASAPTPTPFPTPSSDPRPANDLR